MKLQYSWSWNSEHYQIYSTIFHLIFISLTIAETCKDAKRCSQFLKGVYLMVKKIRIYGKSGWPYTNRARDAHKGHEYLDVKKDRKILDEMLKFSKGKRMVPVIVEGQDVTIGYGGTWDVWFLDQVGQHLIWYVINARFFHDYQYYSDIFPLNRNSAFFGKCAHFGHGLHIATTRRFVIMARVSKWTGVCI